MDRNLKIGVVGLGLIGGSIFKALCALNCDVYGVAPAQVTVDKAVVYNKNVSRTLSFIKDCDIIFVCTPINKTPRILDRLECLVSNTTVVADTCSVKQYVCNRKRPYIFIPTHPMAGTEFSGFDNSFETLFQDAKWIITPLRFTDSEDIKKITDIVAVLGAKPIFSTPDEHDKATALISHMPMIVAQALFKTAQNNKFALKIASSGFRDMTRLATSNEQMATDMLKYNNKYIKQYLEKLHEVIGELLTGNYHEQIDEIKKNRQQIYVNGKNIL